MHETPADARDGGQGEATGQGGGDGNALEALAQAIANLSADDRARLAAMLSDPPGRPDAHSDGGKGGSQ